MGYSTRFQVEQLYQIKQVFTFDSTSVEVTAQNVLDENHYTTTDISLENTEKLMDNAINYVNLQANTGMRNLSGPTAGSKTVTVTQTQASVIKLLTALLIRAYKDRGPSVGVSGLNVSTTIQDPQYQLLSQIITSGIQQLRIMAAYQGVGFNYNLAVNQFIIFADSIIDSHCRVPQCFFRAGGVTLTEYYNGADLITKGYTSNYSYMSGYTFSFRLLNSPILSVENVKEETGAGAWTTRTEGRENDYIVTRDTIVFSRNIPAPRLKNLSVTYMAGYSSTPAVVASVSARLAAAILKAVAEGQPYSDVLTEGLKNDLSNFVHAQRELSEPTREGEEMQLVDYIICKNGDYYEARSGVTEEVVYGGSLDAGAIDGTSLSAVVNACVTDDIVIHFARPSNGVFELDAPIDADTTDNLTLQGSGWGTEIRATEEMAEIVDITESRFTNIKNVFLNGYNNATVGVNSSHTGGWVPSHTLRELKVWGAKEANIDLTGSEDCQLWNVWVDGRIDLSEPPTIYTDYGVRFAANYTGGEVNLFGVRAGFHAKADYYFKNMPLVKLFGCLSTAKSEWTGAEDLEAGLIMEGGAEHWVSVELHGCWFENSSKHNILVKDRCENLVIKGGRLLSDTVENIYGENDPMLTVLSMDSPMFVTDTATYNIDGIIRSCVSNLASFVGASGRINKSNLTKYFINSVAGDIEMNGLMGVTKVIAYSTADALEIGVDKSGGTVNLYDWGASKEVAMFSKDWSMLVRLADDPSVDGWGNEEEGRMWFNTTDNVLKYWDGSDIQIITAEPEE